MRLAMHTDKAKVAGERSWGEQKVGPFTETSPGASSWGLLVKLSDAAIVAAELRAACKTSSARISVSRNQCLLREAPGSTAETQGITALQSSSWGERLPDTELETVADML